jgi:hypothetical protein
MLAAGMQCFVLRQQFVLAFSVGRVRHRGLHRANLGTAGSLKSADAFAALSRVNDIYVIPFADGFIGAFQLTRTALGTFVVYQVGHIPFSLNIISTTANDTMTKAFQMRYNNMTILNVCLSHAVVLFNIFADINA